MKRILSITNVLGVLLFCGAKSVAQGSSPVGAAKNVAATRQPGASLDTSLRNEVDNAKRLAADWLTAHQQPDGSWGSATNNTLLTPIAWLALKGMDNAVDAVARDRAVVWLDSQPIDGSASVDALIWRLQMTILALPDTPERESRIQELDHATQPLFNQAGAYSRWLYYALTYRTTDSALPPRLSAQRQLDRIAPDYPLNTQNTETFWFFARLINRYADGVWLRGTEALDWRNDFARALINAQRKDPAGGAYWNAETGDARIRATAFALLALREID